jgi:hypothetical protein
MAKERNSEARDAIIAEWHKWNPTFDKQMMNGMRFFQYLQEERSELLDFKTSGDKWQDVHGWLRRARCVKE